MENRASIIEYQKKRNMENRDAQQEYNKMYYKQRKEKILEKRRANKKPTEKKPTTNKYYLKNREAILQKAKERRTNASGKPVSTTDALELLKQYSSDQD